MKTPLLAGVMMAGLLLAPSAHACNTIDCPEGPTWIDYTPNTSVDDIYNPLFPTQILETNVEFSVRNAPDQTFEGTSLLRVGEHGGDNYNLTVTQDISGNVPIGEQYNDFTFFYVNPFVPDWGSWGEVYNDIGGTPEAFLVTPFGDINLPTAFVEAVGPTFFEPWASVGLY